MRQMLAVLFIPHAPALFGVSNLIIIIGAIILLAVVAAIIILVVFRNGGKATQSTNQGAPMADWQRQGQPADNAWGQQPQQPGAWGPPQQPQSNAWGAQGVPQQPQAPDWGMQNAPQPQANAWGSQTAWDASASPANNSWGQPQPQQQSQPSWGSPSSPSTTPASSQPGTAPYGGNQTWGPAQDPWAAPASQPPPSPSQPAWPAQGFPSPSANTFPANNNAGQSWQQSSPVGGSFSPVGAGQDSAGLYAGESDRTVLRNTGPQNRLGIVRVEEGKDPGRVYEVRKESLSIGRSRESDIFLEDLAVSRLHASIVNMGSGNYGLKDEGSANGTKVNGQLVPKNQTYPLNEGDKIQLGQTVLVFGKR